MIVHNAAPADFRRDSDLFGLGVRNPDVPSRMTAAMKRGFLKWTPLSRPLFAGNKLMPAEVWV